MTNGFQPWHKDGTYAGYYAAKEDHLATPPATTSFEEAGGVPLAALTAYQVHCPSAYQKKYAAVSSYSIRMEGWQR